MRPKIEPGQTWVTRRGDRRVLTVRCVNHSRDRFDDGWRVGVTYPATARRGDILASTLRATYRLVTDADEETT